ncbi:hypothetical protein K474DRAFT_1772072 [Panus rudis PR-1116 ss-1]|nr:hypothetical protein K474DRAFT_1772072 [Panus rudis PR-1116 ss-1]
MSTDSRLSSPAAASSSTIPSVTPMPEHSCLTSSDQPGQPEGTTQMGRKRQAEIQLTRTNRLKARKQHHCVAPGRHYVRTVEMFESPGVILSEALNRMYDKANGIVIEYDKVSKRRYKAFRALERRIPSLQDDIQEGGRTLQEITAAITLGANGTRSDDTCGVKLAIVQWLADAIAESQRPIAPTNKECRGHNHPVTSRLLCPAALPWSPKVQTLLRTGTATIDGKPVGPSHWPAFLYSGPYNAEAPWIGMLRGPLIVQAFRHIFLSPSSAIADDAGSGRSVKAGNAAIHGMTSVTPASIAYCAAQHQQTFTLPFVSYPSLNSLGESEMPESA